MLRLTAGMRTGCNLGGRALMPGALQTSCVIFLQRKEYQDGETWAFSESINHALKNHVP